MKPKMTLKKIAKEFGVSISTVSKALHNNKVVKKETREAIQAFAKYYDYHPNNIALSLKNQRTKTIGLILPEIVNHFFTKVIRGIEQVAKLRGYKVIIGVSNESMEKEIMNIESLIDGSVDGFIISASQETLSAQNHDHLKDVINSGIPIVMFDRIIEEIQCDKVIVDNIEGSKKAVQELIKTDCKKIILLTTKNNFLIGKLRTLGYKEALKENHIPIDSELIIEAEHLGDTEEQLHIIESKINRLMEKYNDIDGIFAITEILAVTAMNVVRERGFVIPDDISIISFSDGILSKYVYPKLTTVNQHGVLIGKLTAGNLIDRLEKNKNTAFETTIIPTELIKRNSTRET